MKNNKYYTIALENMLRTKNSLEDISFLKEGSTDGDSFEYPIESEVLEKDNLFRKHATIITSTKGDGKIVAVSSDAEAVIMDEGDSYQEDSDTFVETKFNSFKIGSLAKIKYSFVSDNKFDIKDYLNKEFSRRFGRAEEDLCINGNGLTEPTGLLTACSTGVTTEALTYDSIVDLFFSVGKEYRNNAVWIMSDETAMELRKLKDESGTPLWNHNNDTIFGKPVLTTPYMTDDEKKVIFGDLAYYWIIIRKPLSVKVIKEKYMTTNDIGYAANERLDAKLVQDKAIKVLVVSEEE